MPSSLHFLKARALHTPSILIITGLCLFASGLSALSQSQASNGQMEGRVSDQTGAAVPNAVVEVTNIETGFERNIVADERGLYRIPLLPLGTYRITVEAATFKKLVQDGITLATGQTATVDLYLTPGEVVEVVNVSSDTSIADAGKTDLSRVMNNREVQNLPLISRNPYNFGLLQANVNGRGSRGSPFPSINVNGYLRRVNFLLDGNTNTQGDRGSIRLLFISETYISEIQLVTNGFAAEFGNTPGMIMNVVTPSGANTVHGAVAYRFRRSPFYSRPFNYAGAHLPENKTDNITATIGGPIVKDRWHFYFGYENGSRDDKASAMRLLTISESAKSDLIAAGLSPAIFPPAIPSLERGPYYIFRTDLQINESNRLTMRFNHADLMSKNQINGGINTLERSSDAFAIDHGFAAQIASAGPDALNEFRFQYSQRRSTNNVGQRNEFSGPSPEITIERIAQFGSTASTDSKLPANRITHFQNNLTLTRGSHIAKVGGSFNYYDQTIRSPIISEYTFGSIEGYVAARIGANPSDRRRYLSYEESFGNPDTNFSATTWNVFAQDDWSLSRRLKINFGIRYDFYVVPKADPASLFAASREFRLDKNNIAPRLGIAYALREGRRPTILRLGAGIYYDQPQLAMYQRALQNNGSLKFFNFSFDPTTSSAAPNFPDTFSGSFPAGTPLPPQNIDTIAPDFVNMYAIHSNVQLEQVITENLSLAVGFVHSAGRHIPIYRNINPINPVSFLADGRGVFDRMPSPFTRLEPRFNIIQMAESVGVSQYDSFTLQLTKRFSEGLQFSANYTLSRATDDAPEQNLTTGPLFQALVLSNPYDRALDKGYSFADQRHTFVMTAVGRPQFAFESRALRHILNHNQLGIIATANSGETFNIISDIDLNRDGILTSDRPVGIKRNSGTTPAQFNVDVRYSRFVNFRERYRLEVFGEFQNLFNINSIVQYNNVSVKMETDPVTGELTGPLPNFKARNRSTFQESRQVQLGLKFIF